MPGPYPMESARTSRRVPKVHDTNRFRCSSTTDAPQQPTSWSNVRKKPFSLWPHAPSSTKPGNGDGHHDGRDEPRGECPVSAAQTHSSAHRAFLDKAEK